MFYYVRSSPCHDDYLTYPAPSFHLMTSSSSFLTPQAIKSSNSHKNSTDNCTPSKFLAPTTRTVYTMLLISGTGNWEEGGAGAPHNSLAPPLKNVISCMNTCKPQNTCPWSSPIPNHLPTPMLISLLHRGCQVSGEE